MLALLLVAGPALHAQDKDPALDLYHVANAAYNRKLYPAAVGGFKDFLAKHANHPKADLARRGLALSLYAQKQYAEAIPYFQQLLSAKGLDGEVSRDQFVLLLAQSYLRSGKGDDARSLMIAEQEQLKDETFKTAALVVLCDVSFGKSEWDEVRKWTTKLLAAKVTPEQKVRALYQQGFAFYQQKNHEEAAAALSKVLQLDVGQEWKTRAAYVLGECHTAAKQYGPAEEAFAVAVAGLQGADQLECRWRLGVTRFLLGKWEAAGADFDAFIKGKAEARKGSQQKEDPQVAEARLYLGRCLLERGESKAAEQMFQGLAGTEGEIAARAALWQARVFTRSAKPDYNRAAAILVAAIEKHRKASVIDDLRFDAANALMHQPQPDWKAAAGMLTQINAGTFGQMPEVLAQLATCQHKLGDYAGSLKTADGFLQAHADHPLAADVRFIRAENLFLLDRLDDARQACGDFVSKHKGHAGTAAATLRIAQIHHRQGQWEQALAVARPLLQEKPEGQLYAQLAFLVGDSFFRLEKWQEALTPLEEFLAPRVGQRIKGKKNREKLQVIADPNVDTALMELAVCQMRLGQPALALEDLRTLTAFYPQPTPHLALALAEQGRLAYEAGDLKLAREALERFLREEQQNTPQFMANARLQRPRVHYYLGWVNEAEGNHEEAAKHFAEVASLKQPHELSLDAALQQGVAYVNAGNFEAASKLFPEMLKRYPNHEKLPRVTYFAGLSFARMKDWKNAAAHLRKVVEEYGDSEFAAQALYELAWCERSTGRNPQAIELYESFLGKFGTNELALKVQSELAELNLDKGAQDMVIERLGKALAEARDPALREDLRYQLASAHYLKGDHETAALQFEEMIKDYPTSSRFASMCFQAGEARLNLKETAAALDHYAAGLKNAKPDDKLRESMMMRLAEMQTATGGFVEAARTYREFLTRFGESQWRRNAQFGIGWALENSNAPKDAITEYAKLLQAAGEPDLWTVRARYQTGECLFNLQQYDKAIAEFLQVEVNFKKYPDWQAKAVLEIGRVLLAQDKRAEAAERFKDVIKRYPNEKAAAVARQYLDEIRTE